MTGERSPAGLQASGLEPPPADPNGSERRDHGGRRHRVLQADDDAVSDFLELLEDEYTRRILEALADEPRPARELVAACDASRATVYRRLNRLEAHGLVASDVEIHRDGHHRKVFESTLVRATIELVEGSPEVHLTLSVPSTRDDPTPEPIPWD